MCFEYKKLKVSAMKMMYDDENHETKDFSMYYPMGYLRALNERGGLS